MIQAPQLQYVPQQVVQTGYQQQGAYNPVQYQPAQMPGAIYNYPTASSYMPAQTMGHPQYNGVNIEILNPQGQGGCAIPQQNLIPAQFLPIQQPVMQMPQAPVFQPLPAAPVQQPVQQVPVQQIPLQPMPQPFVPQPQIQTETPSAAAPVVAEPAKPASDINPESFAGRLKTDDTDAQKATIEEIAEKVKNSETDGPVLLDTQIFDSLVDIINKDTSSLEGPTPEAIELRQKNPEELTPEEKAKVAPTPLEKAEINKQYALYTISYMQERLNNELEKRNGSALELKDLPCIETVIDTAKSNQNPMLRIGAIAALSHISKPEYNQDLKTIFELAQADEDERVREAATKAAENIGQAK